LAASYFRPDCQRQFPINALKIDPLFVNLMIRNTGNTAVVTAVISIDISPRLCAPANRLLWPTRLAFHCSRKNRVMEDGSGQT
jgi:hypothetical protein